MSDPPRWLDDIESWQESVSGRRFRRRVESAARHKWGSSWMYHTDYSCSLTFDIRPDEWPGGMTIPSHVEIAAPTAIDSGYFPLNIRKWGLYFHGPDVTDVPEDVVDRTNELLNQVAERLFLRHLGERFAGRGPPEFLTDAEARRYQQQADEAEYDTTIEPTVKFSVAYTWQGDTDDTRDIEGLECHFSGPPATPVSAFPNFLEELADFANDTYLFTRSAHSVGDLYRANREVEELLMQGGPF